jgi:hypothetical protein
LAVAPQDLGDQTGSRVQDAPFFDQVVGCNLARPREDVLGSPAFVEALPKRSQVPENCRGAEFGVDQRSPDLSKGEPEVVVPLWRAAEEQLRLIAIGRSPNNNNLIPLW